MSYVLEEMSPADKEKILKDAECDPDKKAWLEVTKFLRRGEGLKWAVDSDRDTYMFAVETMREQSSNSHFYIHVKDAMYEIYVDGLFGGLVEFCGQKPSADVLELVKKEIVSALSVLGRFGQGVKRYRYCDP